MTRLEAGYTTYLYKDQPGLVELLLASVNELGADFPFGELSEEEVAAVYFRAGWYHNRTSDSPALLALRRRIRDGEVPYVLVGDAVGNYMIDFGDAIAGQCLSILPIQMSSALIKRHEEGNLRFHQIPPRLAAFARRGRDYLDDLETMDLIRPESRGRMEEMRRWLHQEDGT